MSPESVQRFRDNDMHQNNDKRIGPKIGIDVRADA
jgi:hypothetical protein